MASDLRRDTILTLEKMGIPVEYSHHESGPSQQEIDLRFADALTMADNVMTYKLVIMPSLMLTILKDLTFPNWQSTILRAC